MAYPYGWTASDVDKGIQLAYAFDAEPQDIFGLWYHESGGLNPRVHPFGDYYGLIGGSDALVSPAIGASWSEIVKNGSLSQQLDAIAKLWHTGERSLGESFASRANKIGTTPAAMIYAMNFVPAYARNVRDADGVLIAGSDPYYADNPAFDTNHKGYISIRDLENKIEQVKGMMQRSPVASIYGDLPASSPYARAAYKSGVLSSSSGGTNWKLLLGLAAIGVVGTVALVHFHVVPPPKRWLGAGESRRRRRAA